MSTFADRQEHARGKKAKYTATYIRKGSNPFASRRRDKGLCTITVELTPAQALKKDKLAAAATPDKYEFLRCEKAE